MFQHTCIVLFLATLVTTGRSSAQPGSSIEAIQPALATSLLPQEQAETAAAPAALPNAGALVRKSLRATGELDALKTASARTLRGTIKLPNLEQPGSLKIVQARPNLFVEQSSVPGRGEITIGSDGTAVWMLHPTAGAQVLSGIVAAQERIRNAFDFGLHSRKHVKTMETVARLEFDGRDCYQVRGELVPFVAEGAVIDDAKTQRYRQFTEYYEVESGLLAGAEAFQATPLGDQAPTTLYRDYKELSKGVKIATTLVTKFGEQEITTTFTALDFEPVDAAFFAPPPAIAAILKGDEAAPADGAETDGGDGNK